MDMYKHLKEISKQLKSDKHIILQEWMRQPTARMLLENNGFTTDQFSEHFGSKVFDFALSVIEEKEDVGDCPVMGVLLMLFKRRNIPLGDLFLICVQLKNVLVNYMIDHGLLTKNRYIEISFVTDQNFYGVINRYIEMYYTKEKLETNDNDKNEMEVQPPKPTIKATDYIAEIQNSYDLVLELDELEEEFIEILEENQTFDSMVQINAIMLLSQYQSTLAHMSEFTNLTHMLETINTALRDTNVNDLPIETKDHIVAYLKGFVSDLGNWRDEVFISQSAEDIHFMDATLTSSAIQLEMMLKTDEEESPETNDIQFF